VVTARHDCAAARFFCRGGNRLGIGCHNDFTNFGGFRASKHVHDHWVAVQIGQRLAWQASGSEARWDKDDCIWHRGCRQARPHDECR
jgi:hypothetical protein